MYKRFPQRGRTYSPGRCKQTMFSNNFCQKWYERNIYLNYPESPFLEFQARITPHPQWKTHLNICNRYPPWIPLILSFLRTLITVLNGVLAMASDYGNTYSAQITISHCFSSRPVAKCPWRTEICLQQRIIIAKLKQFLLLFSTCPEVSLKDADPSAATDRHRKVENVSPSVLDLSRSVLEGRRSISGDRSSSQSRKCFSFCSRPVPKCPWRTQIHQRRQIVIAK